MKRAPLVAGAIATIGALLSVLFASLEIEAHWSTRRLDNAVKARYFSLDKERFDRLSEWLQRLKKEDVLDDFALNQPRSTTRLNIYTEARSGLWFSQPFDAQYLPSAKALILGRDLVEVGVGDFMASTDVVPAFLMFILLHELGHVRLHSNHRTTRSFSRYRSDRLLERQADCFAAVHFQAGDFVIPFEVMMNPAEARRQMLSTVIADSYDLERKLFERRKAADVSLYDRLLAFAAVIPAEPNLINARFERLRGYFRTLGELRLRYNIPQDLGPCIASRGR